VVLPDQLDVPLWHGIAAGDGPPGRPGAERFHVVEGREWLSRRPYHRQRVALILMNLRSFAEELRERGHDARVERTDGPMRDALRALASDGPLDALEPAEREVRAELAPLVREGLLRLHADPRWLTTDEDFAAGAGRDGWRMDAFYRAVRRRTGILMESDAPVGGRWSFDADNRERWDGIPAAPDPPRFARTALREEVEREVLERYAAHPGRLDVEALPATHLDAQALWSWALDRCLPHFGPYEDAMSERSRGLFHTRISPALNVGRISPGQLVRDVLALDLPMQSKEGFVRQVIGWREFVRHVHRATDGFRSIGGKAVAVRASPGDAGFARWSGRPWRPPAPAPEGVDGGAVPAALPGDRTPLPPAWWGAESGLRCLDRVVADVWDEGWSHHITRLMVLGNIATLLDVDARELADWFWVAYADAWDWVVEPNVLGMATYAAGGVMTTKPYVAGAAYVDSMGDSCAACAFSPRSTCPLTRLYWAFLARHEPSLRGNHRMGVVLGAVRKRAEAERARDAATFVHVRDVLVGGRRVTPESLAAAAGGSAPAPAGKRPGARAARKG
jgi:deoxyribodipyrimidine photolyase-related protein